MRTIVSCLALALGLLVPGASRAGIIYQYVTDHPSYSAPVGQTVPVNVFLQETVTGGSQSLLTQTNGLFSYALYVTQTGGPASGQSTLLTNGYTSATPFTGAQASSSASSLPPNSFDVAAIEPFGTTSGPTGTPAGTGVRQILLGTLRITVGTATTFTLESATHSPGGSAAAGADGNTLTFPLNAFYDLDMGGTQSGSAGTVAFTGADASRFTFTVQPFAPPAVPEPGTLALVLMGCAGVGAWRRWPGRRAGRP